MSLLEDVFLQDEANEAQALERIIEGDEYDQRQRSLSPNSDENVERDSEHEDEDKRRIDPTQTKPKRVTRHPRFILNPARLTGPRGIQVIPEHFRDYKFKGKGHEKEDLDLVLKKLEHWAYRLYPKFEFKDCLKKIEILGKKKPVMVHLQKIRSDQLSLEETVVQRDSSDDESPIPLQEEDEFDKLLQEQIEIARAASVPESSINQGFSTPNVNKGSSAMMPKATSSPSISEELRERIARNKRLAEERRLAKLKQNNVIVVNMAESEERLDFKKNEECIDVKINNDQYIVHNVKETESRNKVNDKSVIPTKKTDDMVIKINRSNVNNSSAEGNVTFTNQSTSVNSNNNSMLCNSDEITNNDYGENVIHATPANTNKDISISTTDAIDDCNRDPIDSENYNPLNKTDDKRNETDTDILKKECVNKVSHCNTLDNIECLNKAITMPDIVDSDMNKTRILTNMNMENIEANIPPVETGLKITEQVDMDIDFTEEF